MCQIVNMHNIFSSKHRINLIVICALLFPSCVMAGSIKLKPLNLTATVSTLAGTGAKGSVDSVIGTSASFNHPSCITSDGNNLYVAEMGSSFIRKIVISSGVVTTLAGSGKDGAIDSSIGTLASFHILMGITNDGINLYVADYANNKIRKIVISSGAVTTLAGTGVGGSVDSSTGTSASFNGPIGITTDGANLYVSDANNQKIRKIVISSGAVTTLAGSGDRGTIDSHIGIAASFSQPNGITTDGSNLYVAEIGSSKIRKIVIATGSVTTLAGTGTQGVADSINGTSASFYRPRGIATDGINLYVADTNNNKIRKIVISSGDVTTLAGSGSVGTGDSAIGSSASFNLPTGIATDGNSLYVTEIGSNKIRKIR